MDGGSKISKEMSILPRDPLGRPAHSVCHGRERVIEREREKRDKRDRERERE